MRTLRSLFVFNSLSLSLFTFLSHYTFNSLPFKAETENEKFGASRKRSIKISPNATLGVKHPPILKPGALSDKLKHNAASTASAASQHTRCGT